MEKGAIFLLLMWRSSLETLGTPLPGRKTRFQTHRLPLSAVPGSANKDKCCHLYKWGMESYLRVTALCTLAYWLETETEDGEQREAGKRLCSI